MRAALWRVAPLRTSSALSSTYFFFNVSKLTRRSAHDRVLRDSSHKTVLKKKTQQVDMYVQGTTNLPIYRTWGTASCPSGIVGAPLCVQAQVLQAALLVVFHGIQVSQL